jgi:hypothetical protein
MMIIADWVLFAASVQVLHDSRHQHHIRILELKVIGDCRSPRDLYDCGQVCRQFSMPEPCQELPWHDKGSKVAHTTLATVVCFVGSLSALAVCAR